MLIQNEKLIYVKKESNQEDPYEETNETNGYLPHRNFHELKYINSASVESNENRGNSMHYQNMCFIAYFWFK